MYNVYYIYMCVYLSWTNCIPVFCLKYIHDTRWNSKTNFIQGRQGTMSVGVRTAHSGVLPQEERLDWTLSTAWATRVYTQGAELSQWMENTKGKPRVRGILAKPSQQEGRSRWLDITWRMIENEKLNDISRVIRYSPLGVGGRSC